MTNDKGNANIQNNYKPTIFNPFISPLIAFMISKEKNNKVKFNAILTHSS